MQAFGEKHCGYGFWEAMQSTMRSRELPIVNRFTNRRNSISKKLVLQNYLYLALVIRKQILLCFTK